MVLPLLLVQFPLREVEQEDGQVQELVILAVLEAVLQIQVLMDHQVLEYLVKETQEDLRAVAEVKTLQDP
tara:strand:- start:279 stop:488 length:210 start_codon:yes stop_codon:yes gene_type:complete